MEVIATLLSVLSRTLEIYSLVLLVRVLLSWFPNMDWSNPVLSTVSSITDPYLNAFRGLIPPIGGLDLSAILAFLALNLGQQLLGSASISMMASLYEFGEPDQGWSARSRGRRSSSTPALVRTGELNPRAFTLVNPSGSGVPAGTARRRAKGERPGGTSPMLPTRVLFCRTGSPLASRMRANTSVSTTGCRPGFSTMPRRA
jgi:YggT family protein